MVVVGNPANPPAGANPAGPEGSSGAPPAAVVAPPTESTLKPRDRDNPPTALTELQMHGVAVKDAKIMDYLECTDSTEVRLSLDQIQELADIIASRRRAIVSLTAKGIAGHDPLEEWIKQTADKWEKWGETAKAVQAGALPSMPKDLLTRADLDAAYYTLYDEVMVRGVFLGQEVKDVPTKILGVKVHPRILGLFNVSPTQVAVEPTGPSALRQMGLSTDFTREIYALGQDPREIEAKLLQLEKTRRGLMETMTGRAYPGDLADRVSWDATVTSMLNRNNAGLKLHDEIIAQLEGNATYRSVLDRYRQRNPNIRTVSDLLVTIDNPQDRRIALTAYHEGLMSAANHRFQAKGSEFCRTHFDQESAQWNKGLLVERARQNRRNLEGAGGLEIEQQEALRQIQRGLEDVRDFFQGRPAEGGRQEMTGIATRINGFVAAGRQYRDFAGRPENNIGQLDQRRVNAELVLQIIENFQRNPNLQLPPELAPVAAQIQLAMQTRNNPPVGLQPNELAEHYQRYDQILADLRGRIPEDLNRAKQTAEARLATINARVQAVRTEYDRRDNSVTQQEAFLETEMPNMLRSIDRTLAGLAAVAAAPGNIPNADIVRMQLHIQNLQATRGFLQNGILTNLRRQPGEVTSAYVARNAVQNFQLDQALYRQHLGNLDADARVYSDIIRGTPNEETRARGDAIDLVVTIAGGGLAADDKMRRTGIADVQLTKTLQRLYDEGSTELRDLAQRGNLDVVRSLLCNLPDVLGDPRLRNNDLWLRVFSDQFILQEAVAGPVFRDLEIPDGQINLADPNDRFRQAIISRMVSSPQDMGRFLIHLARARLEDAADTFQTPTNVIDVTVNNGVQTIAQVQQNQRGAARGIFAVEANDSFVVRMRRERQAYYRTSSNQLAIDNTGQVKGGGISITTASERRIGVTNKMEITASEADPIALTIGGNRVELPMRLGLLRIGNRTTFQAEIFANPSLQGLGIADVGTDYNRRWVNLVPRIQRPLGGIEYGGFDNLVNQLTGRLGGVAGDQVASAEIGNFVTRSICDYFLGLPPQQRHAQFRAFPDFQIDNNVYPALRNQGFNRIRMDQTGNVELVRADNTVVVAETALQSLPNAEADQLFRCIGREVFNIM